MTIGVMSDIHISHQEDIGILEKAFRYYRDRQVDGVMIVGDMADTGLTRQLGWISDAWFRVFPKDRLPNGRHVERLFIYGNHDVEAHSGSIMKRFEPDEKKRAEIVAREAIANDRAAAWKKYFREKYEPIYIKKVKGYTFVGAHWDTWDGERGLPAFLEAHHAELAGNKPFFLFQHPHPRNTVYGSWAWGRDNGDSTKAMSQFPNCVCLSGHSHYSLTDDKSVWQGAFTCIGTASMSYIDYYGGRENTSVDKEKMKFPPYQMPSLGRMADGKQGMVMTVYDNHITLERHEFVYDESLGDNWIIPLPLPGDRTFAFDYRAKHEPLPEFKSDDKVTVTRAMGKDRYGKEQMQTTVHFPNVFKRDGSARAFDFEVVLELHEVDVYRISCTKRVFSPHYYLGEKHDDREVTCVFGEYETPVGRDVRFHVRPCTSYGTKGKEIVSDWVSIS